VTRRLRASAARTFALALVVGCSAGPGSGSNLDGLWSLTWAGTTVRPDFGATGPLTLDIAGATARYVGVDAANGVKSCLEFEVAYLPGDLVLLSTPRPFEEEPARWGFAVERSGGGLRLVNALESYALQRVVGAPPVADCAPVATAAPAVELPLDLARSRQLHAVGSTLYVNTGDDGVPIVGWSVATHSVVSTRILTDEVGFGGIEPHLAAAESDDRFIGTCGCGRNDRFTYFDLGSDTAIAQVETSDLGAQVSIRFGYRDPATGHLVLGGLGYDGAGAEEAENRLISVDPATLLLVGQRDVLPEVWIRDVAVLGGRLFALTGPEERAPEIVEVGPDGRALETYALAGAVVGYPVGLAAVGDLLYLLTEDFGDGTLRLHALSVD
jgi:hypothetical protein